MPEYETHSPEASPPEKPSVAARVAYPAPRKLTLFLPQSPGRLFSGQIAKEPTRHHAKDRAEINDLCWCELSRATLCCLEMSNLTAQNTSYSFQR